MEIALSNQNGITPNPSVEFLELCQLAVIASESNKVSTDFQNAFNQIQARNTLLKMVQDYQFGTLIISLHLSVLFDELAHNFCTHTYGEFGQRLNFKPTITAYKLSNE